MFREPRSPCKDDNERLALLPIGMVQAGRQVIPSLLEGVQAENPDCMVYSDMFLWARIIAHAMGTPGVALRPTFASTARFRRLMLEGTAIASSSGRLPERLTDELVYLCSTYGLPFADLPSLVRGWEKLKIVFLPRAFQPDGDSLDERWLFVGPCFHTEY
jgi:hypothetical protein